MNSEHPARGAIIGSLSSAWQIVRANINGKLSERDAGRIRQHLADALKHLHKECREPREPREWSAKREATRARVFAAYGGRCACCGESNPRVLTIDHVEPVRGRRRKGDIYRQLLAEGCPHDGRFQVLCLNCNALKGDGAECQHQREGRERSAA